MKQKVSNGWLSKYEEGGQLPSIVPTDALKTFNFADAVGTKQTKAKNKEIHNTIIHTPNLPMAGNGESWDEATNRVIPTLKNIVNSAPANTTLVTHNSVFGLIDLWNKQNRPDQFSKEQREKYTKQDGSYKTGDNFTIEGVNGPIHVVRHGETVDNQQHNFRSDDTKLTSKGIKQAQSVGKKLGDIDIPQIITSPLDRAVNTANIIAEHQDNKKKEEIAENGWLSKYDQGGDLQEHQPNFNNSSISTPPNFEGLGNLTTGYDYNSAWGGQFQTGGSLPGSVGFTYARIGAPSNGKYAKKTLSSAQNGKNIKNTIGNLPLTDIEANNFDSLSNKLRNIQYDETQNFKKVHPNIPVDDILSRQINDKTFRNSKLNQIADSLNTIHGIKSIPASQDFIDASSQYHDLLKSSGYTQDIKGTNEENLKNFGWRSMLYKYVHPQDQPTYKTIPNMQNGGEMQYYQNGNDFNPKSISQNGSIIKNDRGQWDFPGQITEINSNDITMQGVPYNVLGVSDKGDTKMMQPNKNYKFRGKKVTEYPIAENGKQLDLLDNLVNFTNYNTPQKGGWLNKYSS